MAGGGRLRGCRPAMLLSWVTKSHVLSVSEPEDLKSRCCPSATCLSHWGRFLHLQKVGCQLNSYLGSLAGSIHPPYSTHLVPLMGCASGPPGAQSVGRGEAYTGTQRNDSKDKLSPRVRQRFPSLAHMAGANEVVRRGRCSGPRAHGILGASGGPRMALHAGLANS